MKKLRVSVLTLLLCFIAFGSIAQSNAEEKSKIRLGARYAFVYNIKIAHHKLCFTLMYRQHDFYIGGQYSPVLKPFWGDGTSSLYDGHTFGVNTGYKYYFFIRLKKSKCSHSWIFLSIRFIINKIYLALLQPIEKRS